MPVITAKGMVPQRLTYPLFLETLAPELRLALALATIGAMQVGLGAAGAAAAAAAGLRGVGGEAPLLSALRL